MADDVTTRRVENSGSFLLSIAAKDAVFLFTAEGERQWVPGWAPHVLGSGDQRKGLVFLTGQGSDLTIWTVIDSDFEGGRHLYSRVTPGVRAGLVEVRVSQEGSGSRVDVSYDMTALPGAAEDALAPYEGERFDAMLDEWQSLIEQALSSPESRG
jgi:hypothetical protein